MQPALGLVAFPCGTVSGTASGAAGDGDRRGSDRGEGRMKVGFIGLGKIGRPMTLNLLKAGFEVVINNRSQGVVQELAGQGARAAATPRQVGEQADVVLTCLPTTETVEQVYAALMEVARPGQILIDHSTVSPNL